MAGNFNERTSLDECYNSPVVTELLKSVEIGVHQPMRDFYTNAFESNEVEPVTCSYGVCWKGKENSLD
ncbi:hypothetical protein ScPMuIL_005308 [Solemya velum]